MADGGFEKKLVVIRDRKDPRNKDGNDQKVPFLNLTGYDAWEIVLQQRIVTRGVEAQTIEAPSPCEGRPHHPTRQAVRWRSDNRRLPQDCRHRRFYRSRSQAGVDLTACAGTWWQPIEVSGKQLRIGTKCTRWMTTTHSPITYSNFIATKLNRTPARRGVLLARACAHPDDARGRENG